MIGAIAGDIVGSAFEFEPVKSTQFALFSNQSRFTDDSILTVAVADALMADGFFAQEVAGYIRRYARRFPDAGYGGMFYSWMMSEHEGLPYNSFGNGSAMRVSPVGFAFDTVEDVLRMAELSAAVTHNHPEGIKGAQATALAILMARQGSTKDEIRSEIEGRFEYDLSMFNDLDLIRMDYSFDVTCQGSVPEAIMCFLASEDWESTVRLAVSLGGDADTQACIAGGIAQAFYKAMPQSAVEWVWSLVPEDFGEIILRFNERYGIDYLEYPE